jgi:WD40 repeat protein
VWAHTKTKRITRISFSPDGKRLAAAFGSSETKVWDTASGKELVKLSGGEVVAFSPDGRRVACAVEGGIEVWNLDADSSSPFVLGARIAGLLAAPTGQGSLLAGLGLLPRKGRWEWWGVQTEVRTVKIATAQPVKALAFSPDGRHLAAAGSDRKVVVWDGHRNKGKELAAFLGHSRPVENLVFLADGRRLVSAAEDGTVRGWDLTSAYASLRFGTDYFNNIAHFVTSADGQQLATGLSGSSWSSGPLFTSWSPSVVLWDVSTGKPRGTMCPASRELNLLAMSPDGRRLAAVMAGPLVRILDVATRREIISFKPAASRWIGPARPITALAFAADGSRLAITSEDRVTRVWNVQNGQLVHTLTGDTGIVRTVVFSADGQRITAIGSEGMDVRLRVWDSLSGQELSAGKGPALAAWNPSALSPDGERVASIQGKDVFIWDTKTGKIVLRLSGHEQPVRSVAFSPAGDRLVTGDDEARTILWDTFTGQELLVLNESSTDLSFGADGKILISRCDMSEWEEGAIPGTRFRSHDPEVRIRDATERSEVDRQARWRLLGPQKGEPPLNLFHATGALELPQLTRAIEQQQEEPWAWQVRGCLYAQQNQWDRAAADFSKAIERNRDDSMAWYWYLHMRLQANDIAGYRRGCAEMLTHLDDSVRGWDANTLAWLSALVPGAVSDYSRLVPLAQKASSSSKSWQTLDTLGAVLYRAGRFKEAATHLEEAIKLHGKGGAVGTWLFLAMVRQRLGEKEAARTTLTKAVADFEKALPGDPASWDKRVELQLLRREAETLLGKAGGK